MSRSQHATLVARLFLAFVATLGCMAAVPGDVGGCGQPPDELDAELFFRNRKEVDCRQCEHCGFTSKTCRRACDEEAPVETAFPDGCVPLVHDGEVCLNALEAARCKKYEAYVSDTAPRVPTECEFCPPRGDE